jgi:hypothetical protein
VAIGGVAQLGERELCKLEVVGSIPIASTTGAGSGDPERRQETSSAVEAAGRSGAGLSSPRRGFRRLLDMVKRKVTEVLRWRVGCGDERGSGPRGSGWAEGSVRARDCDRYGPRPGNFGMKMPMGAFQGVPGRRHCLWARASERL